MSKAKRLAKLYSSGGTRSGEDGNPFPVGVRVSITRHRHGWEDGGVSGVVISTYRRTDTAWDYMVKGDNGYTYEVNHQRDLRVV